MDQLIESTISLLSSADEDSWPDILRAAFLQAQADEVLSGVCVFTSDDGKPRFAATTRSGSTIILPGEVPEEGSSVLIHGSKFYIQSHRSLPPEQKGKASN